jgi:hypothetical protein
MDSSVNSSQQRGSLSTVLLYLCVSAVGSYERSLTLNVYSPEQVATLPSLTVVLQDAERLSLRLPQSRKSSSLNVPGYRSSLSVRRRADEMLLILFGARMPIDTVSVCTSPRVSQYKGGHTYSSRSMKHANAKIPQAKPAVFSYASKPVVLVVASPRVEGHRRHP